MRSVDEARQEVDNEKGSMGRKRRVSVPGLVHKEQKLATIDMKLLETTA